MFQFFVFIFNICVKSFIKRTHADSQKVKQYFEKETGESLSLFKANARFDNLLRKFILTDGFDL